MQNIKSRSLKTKKKRGIPLKLIDILVKELPGRCGWPFGAKGAVQSPETRKIFFFGGEEIPHLTGGGWRVVESWGMSDVFDYQSNYEAGDCNTAVVMKNEYIDAIIDKNRRKRVWDGSGIPPVGSEFEYRAWDSVLGEPWRRAKMKFQGDRFAIIEVDGLGEMCAPLNALNTFRVIQDKRATAVKAMASAPKPCGHALLGICEEIYDAIEAGKVPGVKLSTQEES